MPETRKIPGPPEVSQAETLCWVTTPHTPHAWELQTVGSPHVYRLHCPGVESPGADEDTSEPDRLVLARKMAQLVQAIGDAGVAGPYIHTVPRDMDYQRDWVYLAAADVAIAHFKP